jgi:hypothetical protein
VLNDVHEMVSCTATLFSLKSQTSKFKGVKKKDIEKPNRDILINSNDVKVYPSK